MAKQSSARQQSLDFLDNLGADKADFRELKGGLESVCGDFISRVIDNINQFDLIDTGGMSDLSMQVVSNTEINILGRSYINYVDLGVNGVNATPAPYSPYTYRDKMPNPEIFKSWILRKNIKVRNTKYYLGKGEDVVFEGDDKAIDRMAYAMARDRYLNGQEAKPIFQKEIPQLIDDAQQVVGNITIDNIFSNLKLF
ncbi:hypothetical protein [Sphingobacterium sp. 1.A.5]|uniref:hypothetical protein n=1 Tax=Sphingobacterium sp. 1.A.5 TaxID=2044604 RepID=UPI000C0BC89A|nr:hypothetical protein [Sphingobacterium sp. 1.A.5]